MSSQIFAVLLGLLIFAFAHEEIRENLQPDNGDEVIDFTDNQKKFDEILTHTNDFNPEDDDIRHIFNNEVFFYMHGKKIKVASRKRSSNDKIISLHKNDAT